uniref:Uncharacterized protein n=1 Tax=Anguilla anguilla TaxID=7936 RepID=A0A0E9X519_ANGAN
MTGLFCLLPVLNYFFKHFLTGFKLVYTKSLDSPHCFSNSATLSDPFTCFLPRIPSHKMPSLSSHCRKKGKFQQCTW